MKIPSLLVLLLLRGVAAGQGQLTPTQVQLSLSARSVVTVQAPGSQHVFVREAEGPTYEGTPFTPRGGSPDIALRAVEVLLPPDCDVATLSVAHAWSNGGAVQTNQLGQYDVAPTGIARTFDLATNQETLTPPTGVQLDALGRNQQIYGQNAFWPARPVTILNVSHLRSLKVARLSFAPFQWNPVTRQLRAVQPLSVTLSWQRLPLLQRELRRMLADPVVIPSLDQRFINVHDLGPWYGYALNSTASTYDYVIITTANTVSNSGQLKNFVDHKQSQGHKVGVFTVEWIDDHYSGDERADRMRAFLKARYLSWGIRYVLLIGDPDPYDRYESPDLVGAVPMKMAWPRGDGWESKADGEACPTDHYYADLSGEWDVDGDGYAAAYDDDYTVEYYHVFAGGLDYVMAAKRYGFDMDAEVLVGRIGFSDLGAIDTVLAETIEYQQLDLATHPGIATRRKRVFLAMSNFSDASDNSYLGRALAIHQTHPAGLFNETFYEPGSAFAGEHALEDSALEDAWSALPAGLVVWTGHGSPTHAEIRHDDTNLMHAGFTSMLNDGTRTFVIQGSCQNAWPEEPGNLANALLESIAVGAFAGTRNSWYADNKTTFGDDTKIQDVVWRLAKGLVEKNSGGYALSLMRAAGVVDESIDLQNLITYNFYGDPSGLYKFE